MRELGMKARAGDVCVLECVTRITPQQGACYDVVRFQVFLVDSATREGKIKRVCRMGNGGQPWRPYPPIRPESYNPRTTYVASQKTFRDPIRAVAESAAEYETLAEVRTHLTKYRAV